MPEDAPSPHGASPPPPALRPVGSDERAMIYSILSASQDDREQAARQLGLLGADDELRTSSDEAALLERARSTQMLAQLARALGHA